MKINLISPRMSLRATDSEYKRVLSPPLSLLTLSALTPDEHKVKILDENTGKLGLQGGLADIFDVAALVIQRAGYGGQNSGAILAENR